MKDTPNDENEKFVTTHMEAAAKYIPINQKAKCRVPCMSIAVREK